MIQVTVTGVRKPMRRAYTRNPQHNFISRMSPTDLYLI